MSLLSVSERGRKNEIRKEKGIGGVEGGKQRGKNCVSGDVFVGWTECCNVVEYFFKRDERMGKEARIFN